MAVRASGQALPTSDRCHWPPCTLQSSKVLAKRELLCVPLICWTLYFLEIVFCKRKWEEDRDIVKEGLKRLADYPECMWVSVLHVP